MIDNQLLTQQSMHKSLVKSITIKFKWNEGFTASNSRRKTSNAKHNIKHTKTK